MLKLLMMFMMAGLLVSACIQADVNNTDWTPQYKIFDGVEMALVPAGCFTMGFDENNLPVEIDLQDSATQYIVEKNTPPTEICFDKPFWIDRYEVTNAQFRQFKGVAKSKGIWTADNRPRDSISWREAKAFCELRGARLPSKAEWEYAARGPNSLFYPWGNRWNADYVVKVRYSGLDYKTDPTQQTADVGSKPLGASWVGALDMAGNVAEWTNTVEIHHYNGSDGSGSYILPVVSGGTWRSRLVDFLAMSSIGVSAIFDFPEEIGFRCARSE